jgi:ATP-binding protein involved in chromosome partitioning
MVKGIDVNWIPCDPSAKFILGAYQISNSTIEKFQLPGVKHIVAVASGKGGVGKSTVATNLALALVAQGHKAGLLDADIYGPSLGTMMGVPEGTKPEVQNDFLQPIIAHGVQCMSMSFLASERTPAVWRGPMASGALQQLLTQTNWVDVDYLVVDMPPGTGDIQLTLAQRVPLSGAIIVTTPQDIALLDARKGIEMFRKVEIPVLGIVENMSTHICSSCGHEEAIFGIGGGNEIALEYDTKLLAQLPLSISIREQGDSGIPTVAADPEGSVSKAYSEIAASIVAAVEATSAETGPVIRIVDD